MTLPKLIGHRIEEAYTISEKAGFVLRIVEEDGRSRIGTCDYRRDRINVATHCGEVVEILHVG